MKNLILFILVTLTLSCKQSTESKIDSFLRKHQEPTSEKMNNIKVGQTIVFGYSEQQGIDRGSYPAPRYYKDIDTNYFKYQKSESFSDGANGGYEYNYSIYKAIKKGTTAIQSIKETSPSYERISTNDTARTNTQKPSKEIVSKYEFIIQ
jgi:hypothetical protein